MSGTDRHGDGYFLLDAEPLAAVSEDRYDPRPLTRGYRVDDAPDFFEVEVRPDATLPHTDGLDE